MQKPPCGLLGQVPYLSTKRCILSVNQVWRNADISLYLFSSLFWYHSISQPVKFIFEEIPTLLFALHCVCGQTGLSSFWDRKVGSFNLQVSELDWYYLILYMINSALWFQNLSRLAAKQPRKKWSSEKYTRTSTSAMEQILLLDLLLLQ